VAIVVKKPFKLSQPRAPAPSSAFPAALLLSGGEESAWLDSDHRRPAGVRRQPTLVGWPGQANMDENGDFLPEYGIFRPNRSRDFDVQAF
jgi:hypothetical protein